MNRPEYRIVRPERLPNFTSPSGGILMSASPAKSPETLRRRMVMIEAALIHELVLVINVSAVCLDVDPVCQELFSTLPKNFHAPQTSSPQRRQGTRTR